MSQDRFWDQWGGAPGQAAAKPPDQKPADPAEGLNYDVLAAWLKEPPPNDPLATGAPPAGGSASWTPAASVDPFAGIARSSNLAPGDWDLSLDPTPGTPAPPATPAVPQPGPANTIIGPPPGFGGTGHVDYASPSPPVAAVPPPPEGFPAPPQSPGGGGGFGGSAGPAVLPPAFGAVSPAPPAPVIDLGFDLGPLSGPVPGADPFAPPDLSGGVTAPQQPVPAPPTAGLLTAPAPIAPPPPTANPFGPPVPVPGPPPEALQAGPLKLEVSTGRRTIEQVVRGEALIGRPDASRGVHPEIDLRLDDAVSRRHAKIYVRDGRYVLTDLNSTNGTRYNRQFLQPEVEMTLKAGDEIEVGEITLIRVLEAPEPGA